MRDTINDCFVDVTGVKPTEEQIDKVIETLPSEIKNIADDWGPNDTEFREKVYAWLEENKKTFK